ncbi:MAG: glycosyltransferase [Verrucomicrobia bacterium]|nr:glycosyltransferase [Verrucomicrobiota bacterium]
MPLKATIRLDFCDFWENLDKTDNYFIHILRKRFRIVLSSSPDFVIFCGNTGHHHRLHSCVRISFDGEGRSPDFSTTDYAMSSNYSDDPRHLRLPLYVLYGPAADLVRSDDEARIWLARKARFCAFVVGHSRRRTENRIRMFKRLDSYKRVDSGGRALNNIGGPLPPGGKHEFLQSYKFNLCYENRSKPGYTTEKIYEAMRARCVPIYWGSPQVHTEFNPKSFINALDFPNEELLVEHIRKVDENEALYLRYLREPYFHDNKPNEFFSEERLLDFFERIFSTPIKPVGQRRSFFEFRNRVSVKKDKSRRPIHWD